LIYNDYGNEGINAKSNAIYNMVADMLSRGIPIHGVGFQLHVTLSGINLASFSANLQRFADLGLEAYITELDVRIQLPVTDQKLATQANVYQGILGACLAQPACKALQMWGFTDAHSWIPGFFQGFGAALIFDESYQPKPAYDALAARLGQRASLARQPPLSWCSTYPPDQVPPLLAQVLCPLAAVFGA
jgi:endo-1,4-beta-xylanase